MPVSDLPGGQLKQTRVRPVVVAICAALSLATSSFAQVPPLWGALQPGPERVGFTTVFRFDPERTWARTYDAAGVFVPDSNGRPVQVSVWYPAQATGPCAGMSFGGAVDVDVVVPPPLADFASAMRLRNREDAHSAVPAERFSELLSTPLHSCAGAPPSGGDAPLVLYAGGLNAPAISNIVLAEFLASHGFAVASVSLVGAGDAQVTQSRSAIDLEATVRDLEFASTVVRELGLARGARVAVVGHSLGAVAAIIFAARHGNTRAAIGLDGTYGFEGAGSLLTTGFGYDPTRMRAAVLDIRRAEGEQEARLDMASVRAMKYARRDLVAIGAMHHSDFTSFAMVADRFLTPIDPKYAGTRWDRRTGRHGHETTARLILALLFETLKADPLARGRFEALARKHESVRWAALVRVAAAAVARGDESSLDDRGSRASQGEVPRRLRRRCPGRLCRRSALQLVRIRAAWEAPSPRGHRRSRARRLGASRTCQCAGQPGRRVPRRGRSGARAPFAAARD